MRLLFKKEPSRIFWKYISDTITSASTKGLIKRKQAELGVPHSKSKLSGQNQIHLASWSLPDFFWGGGRTGQKD